MTPAPDDADRLARAVLSRVSEPGDPAIARRVGQVGAVTVLEELREGCSPIRRSEDYLPRLHACDPAADLERLAELGGTFLVPGDLGWPSQLADLGAAAPLALWCRGAADLRIASLRSVAVVGSRACTEYGVRMSGELGAGLAQRGWAVVSGGAYGIDAAAHRGAISVDGITVAVVAGGVDVMYPKGHDALFARVLDGGAVVSEVPPGCAPTRLRFLVRNRLIAALSRGTVVVEAAVRSGALSTAAHAERLNRVLMGVPGPATAATSQGVHAMLQSGALLVTSASDVVAAVGPLDASPAPGPSSPVVDDPRATPSDARGPSSLDADSRRVWEALPLRRGAVVDRLAVAAGLAPLRVVTALGRLELTGWATCGESGWRRVPRDA